MDYFFKKVPDFEDSVDANDDNVYEITVVASDGSNRGTLDVTITVTNVNEGPEVTGQNSFMVNENHDQTLDTYTATDPEGAECYPLELGGLRRQAIHHHRYQ